MILESVNPLSWFGYLPDSRDKNQHNTITPRAALPHTLHDMRLAYLYTLTSAVYAIAAEPQETRRSQKELDEKWGNDV